MGRKKRVLPTVRHGEEYYFRPSFEDGNFSLVSLGRVRYANELSYGYLGSGWRKALEPNAPGHLTDENWSAIERVLERYIFGRASELGAMPWPDAMGALEKIAKCAAGLLAASDAGNASAFIWQRMAVSDMPFSRDDFYPLLSALNHRAHLLLAEMKAERQRGVQLSIFAFRHFVLDIANFYRATGGTVRVSKISEANRYATRPTSFSVFAWEAMKQIPVKLRQHCSNPDGWSFFDALNEEVSHLRKIGALEKNTQHTFPKKRRVQRR